MTRNERIANEVAGDHAVTTTAKCKDCVRPMSHGEALREMRRKKNRNAYAMHHDCEKDWCMIHGGGDPDDTCPDGMASTQWYVVRFGKRGTPQHGWGER